MRFKSGKAYKGEVREGLFCSRECRAAWMKSDNPPEVCKVYFKKCVICKIIFCAHNKQTKACSEECRSEWKRSRDFDFNSNKKILKERLCKECGKPFIPIYGNQKRIFCSKKCSKRYAQKANGAGNYRKRARYYGVKYEYINVLKIFDRDRWHCQICGKATPMKNKGTLYTNAPELDHRIPISKGGGHLYSNVQCACRKCNGLKSNKNGMGQLPLFVIKLRG